MTKVAIVALLSAVCACATASGGSGDDDDIVLPDAAPGVADAGGGSPVDASGGTPDATPVGTPCDPIAQNCGPGQKCALIVTDVAAQTGFTGCYPNGDKGLAQACATPSVADTADDCIAGAHCVFGTCHAICKLGSNPCADGQCIGINNLEMQFDVCLPSCDPLAPACSPGEGCYLTGMDQGVCAPPVGGGQPPGGPCTAPNDCAPGSGCFNDPGQCLSYCDYATYPGERDPARCASGEVCGPITGETRVGACR